MGWTFKSAVFNVRFPLFAMLVAYTVELLVIPFQVFWANGESEFWGYGLVLSPPDLGGRGVAFARLDFIALEMMLTTIAVFVWYFITSSRNRSPQ